MKRVNIIFDDREYALLVLLNNYYGGSIPETIRNAVKFHFDKSFPPHTRGLKRSEIPGATPEEDLTPEQVCEQAGGKVENVNGIQMCVLKMSDSMSRKIPLSDTVTILKYKKP